MAYDKDMSVEERLEKAKKPGQDAMILHKFYQGKIETVPKACVRSFDDFAVWYSPGVAEPCKDIAKNPDMVYEHTCKWNTVAVVSDGTRVLGLGDIGPEAAMPVMEGKAMLFKYLGGVDCVPICLDTKDPDKIIETVRLLAPSFGGINLEDISNPKCFDILDELRKDCKIPVKDGFRQKWEICEKTNGAGKTGGLKEAMEGADIVIAASKPGPGTIPPEYVRSMADDPVIFATANPIPEIWPWEAKENGCKVFATGRSDFPNQVNNSMGFPAIFRGVLDVRAKTITDEMCIAAARELAACAEEKGLTEDYIIPTMAETEVFPREAVAVAMKAQEQGVARLKLSRQELHDRAEFMINRSRNLTAKMMQDGFIPDCSSVLQ